MTTPSHPAVDDLAARVTTSDLDGSDLPAIPKRVEELCCEYSTADPAELKNQSENTLREIDELLDRRLTLTDHRVLLEQAGWLVLLIAALAFDLGHPETAERARKLALSIGQDLQDRSILGWAHETAVWMEIANRNWTDAIRTADEGLAVTGEHEPTGVAIQLALQQAEASARLGDTAGVTSALDRARRQLASHEPPSNPRNHFAFDHAKFDLREMRTLLVAGQDDQAERIAIRLESELQNPDGTSEHPMRLSEVLASRGLLEARRGNIDEAVDFANRAIAIGRRSRLSFQQITSAVADELTKHDHVDSVRRFLAHRAQLLGVVDEG